MVAVAVDAGRGEDVARRSRHLRGKEPGQAAYWGWSCEGGEMAVGLLMSLCLGALFSRRGSRYAVQFRGMFKGCSINPVRAPESESMAGRTDQGESR